MPLHYLVKFKTFIAHVHAITELLKKLQNVFHLNYGLQICQI